jgi:hypothetical protein
LGQDAADHAESHPRAISAIVASSILVVKKEPRTAVGLSSDDIVALIRNNPNARDIVQVREKESTKYRVTFYSPVRPDDFAKQILTLGGTLMGAVIAFYFGAASRRATGDIGRSFGGLRGRPGALQGRHCYAFWINSVRR